MKAGYKVIDGLNSYDKILEVINKQKTNEIIHLGWISPITAYKCKSNDTVGVWKLKKIKN